MNYFRNLNSEWIEIPTEGYYNLETGRIIKKKESYKNFIFNTTFCVCGTKEQIQHFILLNEKEQFASFDCFQNYSIQSIWNLNGIITVCKVIHVIDGDTYDIDIYLQFDRLKRGCTINQGSGIFRFRCRLYGIDTKEKNTYEGQFTWEYCQKRIQENNLFYCQCFGNDKYGRLMVKLYADPQFRICFNSELLDLKAPNGKSCCQVYFGGHKNE